MLAPQLLALLRERIALAELNAHEGAIVAAALPAIDLILDGASDGTIGESRFGGAPDLPTDMDWPCNEDDEALTFLAQINLAEIPEFDGNPLPARGWLMVFIGLDEPASDVENLLFLVDADAELAPATLPDDIEWANDEDFVALPAQKLRFHLRADIPHWATEDFSDLAQAIAPDDADIDDAQDALNDIGSSLNKTDDGTAIGQLFGHASGIGHDPREGAFIIREVGRQYLYDSAHKKTLDMTRARNWLNLLRIDSFFEGELSFSIWDAGYLNFLIHRDDLTSLDWSRVYAAVETS